MTEEDHILSYEPDELPETDSVVVREIARRVDSFYVESTWTYILIFVFFIGFAWAILRFIVNCAILFKNRQKQD